MLLQLISSLEVRQQDLRRLVIARHSRPLLLLLAAAGLNSRGKLWMWACESKREREREILCLSLEINGQDLHFSSESELGYWPRPRVLQNPMS